MAYMVEVRHLYKVNFNLNGGSGEFATIRTDHLGHIAIPENVPQAPAGNRPLFFRGWYTGKTGGEMITEEAVPLFDYYGIRECDVVL